MRKIFFKLYNFFCQTVNSRYWKNEVHLGIWRTSVSVKVCACLCVCVSVRGTVQVGPNCEKGAKASWASVQCPLGPAELKEWGISSNPKKEKNLSGKEREGRKKEPTRPWWNHGVRDQNAEKAASYFVQTPPWHQIYVNSQHNFLYKFDCCSRQRSNPKHTPASPELNEEQPDSCWTKNPETSKLHQLSRITSSGGLDQW